jgi:antitoxin VapB
MIDMEQISTKLGGKGVEPRTARLFRNGRNQAVRLPRDYEIDAEEVYIQRDGDSIVIRPKPRSWDAYFEQAGRLSEGFPDTIEDAPPQQREAL